MQRPVALERRQPVLRQPLLVLRNRALQQRDFQRLAGGRLRILSDNPAYTPEERKPSADLAIVGRVVAVLQRP